MSYMTEIVARAKAMEQEKKTKVVEAPPKPSKEKDYSDMVSAEKDPVKQNNLMRQLDTAGYSYTAPVKTGAVTGSIASLPGVIKSPVVNDNSGVPTTKADGTLTDYGKSLVTNEQTQREASQIMSTYKPPKEIQYVNGMYANYEDYVANSYGSPMSRERFNQALVEKQAQIDAETRQRERIRDTPQQEQSISTLLPNLGGVTQPIVKPPVVPPTPLPHPVVPSDVINVGAGLIPVNSVVENRDLTQLLHTVKDTNITPAMWKLIVQQYPELKTLYEGLRS